MILHVIVRDCNTLQILVEKYLLPEKAPIWIDDFIMENELLTLGIDYDIEITILTLNQAQGLEYLKGTDWYVIRFNDPSSGEEIPQDILDNRANARDQI